MAAGVKAKISPVNSGSATTGFVTVLAATGRSALQQHDAGGALVGDGAGYDIASFRTSGAPLHIEVKTTNLGVRTPFHITRWEVEVSRQQATRWALYRVFDFRSDPRVYRLEGSVDESARLEPSVFLGWPR